MSYDFNDHLRNEYSRVIDEWTDPYPYGDYPDGIDEMADDREQPGIFVWLWRWIRGRL